MFSIATHSPTWKTCICSLLKWGQMTARTYAIAYVCSDYKTCLYFYFLPSKFLVIEYPYDKHLSTMQTKTTWYRLPCRRLHLYWIETVVQYLLHLNHCLCDINSVEYQLEVFKKHMFDCFIHTCNIYSCSCHFIRTT